MTEVCPHTITLKVTVTLSYRLPSTSANHLKLYVPTSKGFVDYIPLAGGSEMSEINAGIVVSSSVLPRLRLLV